MDPHVDITPLQSHTFVTKYARWNPELKRRESFDEAVERVFDMHATKYADCNIAEELAYAKAAVLDHLVLGSQRALQFGGKPILNKNARIYSCTTSYADRARFFQECLWLLLCGCGVGFSVQQHHVDKLPGLLSPRGEPVVFTVPDSIEGWADALGVVLAQYGITAPEFAEYHGRKIVCDYSKIRPRGASIASGSGKAPGPEPLKRSIVLIEALLEEASYAPEGSNPRLRPIDVYDIVMHASDAVLAGGVRRSATIAIFSPDDHEMATAKTGDWFIKNPQRGRSNNSALLLRDTATKLDFARLMHSVKECGEPGFIWADSTEIVYNPCVEIGLYPSIEIGGVARSGWAFCNLCEINMKACHDVPSWTRACKAAAILGTLQAGYTSFDYLGKVSEEIAKREALLGCSMTGMMDNPDLAFNPELQRSMAQLILAVNEVVAQKIGTNPTARATCVKPAGTTSCILGTASGIHPHHAPRYFRRTQSNDLDAPAQLFRLHNPRAVEKSVWNPNGTDLVLTFCVQPPPQAKTRGELSAVDLLRYVQTTQENWVAAGRVVDRCAKPWLSHNVSNTITVRDDEWDAVTDYIYANRSAFAGVSLLPMGGDLDYPQAPFVAVWTFEQIVAEYGIGSLMASGLIVDGLHAFDSDLWAASACALDRGESLDLSAAMKDLPLDQLRAKVDVLLHKRDWVRRAKQFAYRYFKNDVRAMTHCLKRVSNCKLWEDLQRETTSVDYKLMQEHTDATSLMETIACGGGKCDIV
jgi:ribonucleoside-diphosphate reductase alpha chain